MFWQPQRTSVISLMCTICIDLYRRSSSAIRRIVGSLIPTIDANFCNACPESFKISPFNDCESPRDAFFRVTLPRWHTGTFVELKLYILPQRHKQLISGIQKTELFPCWAPSAKAFDYIPHLVLTSRSFWKYDCLLKASGFFERQQQSLAETQYSRKFKLKFIRILATHLLYLYFCQFKKKSKKPWTIWSTF